jgi:outer membrane protein insertion porin family/translocation and assembly module TamA
VYIARNVDVNFDSTTTAYEVADTSGFDRIVPLGGNRLIVANLEYRVPDRLILPNLLQWTFFVDAGDVWNNGGAAKLDPKVTPGMGVRLITPIGPFAVNFGYNWHPRADGAMYFEDPALASSVISPLYCVSPGNGIPLTSTGGGPLLPPDPSPPCPNYHPLARRSFFQRLTITFSIGPDF